MKVILLDDIKGVGKKDQIIEAADGYARNFLFPKKLAVEANKVNISTLDKKRRDEEQKRVREFEAAKEFKEKLESVKIQIPVKTGEGGKLFGSVSNKEIAQALNAQFSLSVDKKKINLPEPIKTLGEKTVEIKLHTDVKAMITLNIVSA
ncbi:MAG: 50S ribosomal protein L9 [Clostridiales bacterium]|nr:50S ribosomal protein L9 [Clostridiales bacterium]